MTNIARLLTGKGKSLCLLCST